MSIILFYGHCSSYVDTVLPPSSGCLLLSLNRTKLNTETASDDDDAAAAACLTIPIPYACPLCDEGTMLSTFWTIPGLLRPLPGDEIGRHERKRSESVYDETWTHKGHESSAAAAAATHSYIVLWDNPKQAPTPPTVHHSTARQSNGSCDSLFTRRENERRRFGNNE